MYWWAGMATPRLEAEPFTVEEFDRIYSLKPNVRRVRAPSSSLSRFTSVPSGYGDPPLTPKSEPSSTVRSPRSSTFDSELDEYGEISTTESKIYNMNKEASRRGREGGRGVALTVTVGCQRPRSSANPIKFSVACPALVRLSTTAVVCKLLSTWRVVNDRGRLQTLVRLSTTAVVYSCQLGVLSTTAVGCKPLSGCQRPRSSSANPIRFSFVFACPLGFDSCSWQVFKLGLASNYMLLYTIDTYKRAYTHTHLLLTYTYPRTEVHTYTRTDIQLSTHSLAQSYISNVRIYITHTG
jgi:hypothetical protein